MARGAGDYLKTRRALIRSVEKQAAMAERLDALKTAIFEGAPGAPLRVCGAAWAATPASPPAVSAVLWRSAALLGGPARCSSRSAPAPQHGRK